jgi:hypothetical protein
VLVPIDINVLNRPEIDPCGTLLGLILPIPGKVEAVGLKDVFAPTIED